MNPYFRVLFTLGLFLPFPLFAQNTDDASLKKDSAYIEIAGMGATDPDHLPFWLHTNQWGIVPKSGQGGSLRAGWEGSYPIGRSTKKDGVRFIGGLEAVENITSEAKFLLPQAYAGVRIGKFEAFVGRKKQQVGLADSTMGTGSYVMSGNAMPHFRIQVGFHEYTNIPFTQGWLQFIASYSDGIMDANRPVVTNLKLHQKQLYMRLGNPEGWLRLYGGFNHQAQWGGKSPYFFNPRDSTDKQMPRTMKTYLEMVFGTRGPTTSPDHHDSTNRIGNHLGTIDVGFEIRTFGADLLFYRQNIYEDGSLYSFINIADGLNGVRIRRKNRYGSAFEIHEAVLEFLYTKSQGGPEFEMDDPKKRGRDNYFNNYQVRDGWSYQMRTIGTPFITPGVDTRHLGQSLIYGDSFTNNNRVWAAHAGLKGAIANTFFWTTKFSYSRNFGTYDLEHVWPKEGIDQFSGLVSLQRTTQWMGGMTVGLHFSWDYGDLYPVSYGGMLTLKKHINF